MPKKIVLIDKHPMVFYGLQKLFEEYGYSLINAYAEDADIYKVILQTNPEFIILDVHRLDMGSAEIVRVIQNIRMISRTIVLSEYDNLHYQNECMSWGIRAYISKEQEVESLIYAMRAIKNGLTYYPLLNQKRKSRGARSYNYCIGKALSEREQSVLMMLSSGLSNKEISEVLKISIKTVSTHKQRMLEKLGANSLLEAMEIIQLHELSLN